MGRSKPVTILCPYSGSKLAQSYSCERLVCMEVVLECHWPGNLMKTTRSKSLGSSCSQSPESICYSLWLDQMKERQELQTS